MYGSAAFCFAWLSHTHECTCVDIIADGTVSNNTYGITKEHNSGLPYPRDSVHVHSVILL